MSQTTWSVKKILWIWFFTMLALRLVYDLRDLAWVGANTGLLTAMLLIYIPLVFTRRQPTGLKYFESTWQGFAIALAWGLGAAIVLLPLLEIGNRFFQDWILHRSFYSNVKVPQLAYFIFYQLVLVALPEEFFFRGFMQPLLNQHWGKPFRFLGASCGWALPFTAAIFALTHSLIQFQWWHFSIFIPALVFGWLRERTGAITASIVFHALSNGYSYWVGFHYR